MQAVTRRLCITADASDNRNGRNTGTVPVYGYYWNPVTYDRYPGPLVRMGAMHAQMQG